MLPRLKAEESMARANEISFGTGSLTDDARRRLADRWQRDANGGRLPRAVKATPAQLRALGIGVRVEKRPTESGDGR